MPASAVTWMERAQCRGEDPSLWFPSLATDPVKARVICSICPVSKECLEYALGQVDLTGIWAGTSGKQRQKMRSGRRKW
ncbi:MAG: WhiB family transcriptional regulator [Acidimicrobiales bacterium]